MKNQNENAAVSDVTARMREEASILSLLNGQSVGVASVAKKLREFADSIDAAVSKMETATYGNNAGMRAALIECVDMLSSFKDDPEVAESISIADEALKEPPRNCDLFGGDYKMLHTAWFDWTGSPSGQNPDGTAKMVFGEWLLELAGKRGAV